MNEILSDILTFYYPRDMKGVVREFPSGPRASVFLVNGDGKLPEINKSESLDEYKARLKTGCLIVKVTATESPATVSFNEGLSNDFPKSCFLIDISGRAIPRDVSLTGAKGKVEVQPWQHLVVPVNSRAEAGFVAFQKFLSSFPPSYETSILHLLRRPSLEWRVSRIEQSLDRYPPGPEMGDPRTRARSTHPWWRVGGVPVWALWTAAAILLLAVGAGLTYYLRSAAPATSITALDQPSTPPAAPGAGTDPTGEVRLEKLQAAYWELITQMKESPQPVIKRLLKSHDLSKQPWLSTNAAVAIAKLELLRNGDLKKESPDLTDPNKLNETTTQLKAKAAKAPSDAWKSQNVAPEITFFSCNAYNLPSLPDTTAILNMTCDHLPASIHVLKGLEELNAWVSK